jgi:Ca2+-binding RTX toxin-like protein
MAGSGNGRRFARAVIATALVITGAMASNALAATASFTNNQLQVIDDRFTDDMTLTYFATPGTPAQGPGVPATPERHFANINDAVGVEPSTGCIFATPPMTGVTCEVPVTPYTARVDLGPGYDRFVSNLRYDPAGASGVPADRTYMYDGEGGDSVSFNYTYPNDATPVTGAAGGGVFVYGGPGNDTYYLTPFNDSVLGLGQGYDKIYANSGNDVVYAGSEGDYVRGGLGNDNIYGQAGNDYLHGDAGNDYINGGLNGDHLYGELGNDRLYGGGHTFFSFDFCFGGLGIDTINGVSRDFGLC